MASGLVLPALQPLQRRQDHRRILRIGIKDSRAVLRADIRPLAVYGNRIDDGKKQLQQLL